MPDRDVIVVDGANVAFIEPSKSGDAKVANLVNVRKALRDKGYDPIVIIDAALRHKIDDPDQLERLIDANDVHQAPAGTDADYFVIETAERHGAQVVSNDTYKDYRDRHKWIDDRRVPLMIIHGKVELHEESLNGHKRNGRDNHKKNRGKDKG